jgi:hypothetical protein
MTNGVPPNQPGQLSGTRHIDDKEWAVFLNQAGSLIAKSVFQDSAGQSVFLDSSGQSVFIGSDGLSITNVLEEIYNELMTINTTLNTQLAAIAEAITSHS